MYVFRMASFHRKCAASLHGEQMLTGGGVGQGQSTVNFSSERPATSAIKTQKPQLPLAGLPSMESRSSTALGTEGSHTVSQNTCHPPFILCEAFDVDLQMATLDFSFCLCKQSQAIWFFSANTVRCFTFSSKN